MCADITTCNIRDMIIDRVIMLSESQLDDNLSDEIIGMLTALHDRTIMNTDKVSDVEYNTAIGTIVREKEYESGNVCITLSSHKTNEKHDNKNTN